MSEKEGNEAPGEESAEQPGRDGSEGEEEEVLKNE